MADICDQLQKWNHTGMTRFLGGLLRDVWVGLLKTGIIPIYFSSEAPLNRRRKYSGYDFLNLILARELSFRALT